MSTAKLTLLAALLLTAAALPQAANAKAFAYLPNEVGGKIFLTDEPCKYGGTNYPALARSYGYNGKGVTIESCWILEEDTNMIRMIWLPGSGQADVRLYSIGDFTLLEKAKTAKPAKSSL